MSYKKLEIWERAREDQQLEILGKKLNLFIQAVERTSNKQPVTSNQ